MHLGHRGILQGGEAGLFPWPPPIAWGLVSRNTVLVGILARVALVLANHARQRTQLWEISLVLVIVLVAAVRGVASSVDHVHVAVRGTHWGAQAEAFGRATTGRGTNSCAV